MSTVRSEPTVFPRTSYARSHMFRRVLVGLDRRDGGRDAIAFGQAAGRARRRDRARAHLRLGFGGAPRRRFAVGRHRTSARAARTRAGLGVGRCATGGVRRPSRRPRASIRLLAYQADAVYGRPWDELVRFGEHLDLVPVGSRGYGPLGRLFLGGVSDYLARHAPRPLLILPRGSVPSGEADLAGRAEEPVTTGALR
jgi:nucleotide-binding universal stress UspA family protein